MKIRPADPHGALLVFLFLFVLLAGCSDEQLSKDVSAIKSRLEKIETRLVTIEKSAKRTSILEVELHKMQQSMDAWERAIAVRLKPGVLKPKPASAKKKNPKTGENKNSKTRYYTVKKGDSIYGIAGKHGMTTDELCKLNKMDVKTILHPGQRLLVF